MGSFLLPRFLPLWDASHFQWQVIVSRSDSWISLCNRFLCWGVFFFKKILLGDYGIGLMMLQDVDAKAIGFTPCFPATKWTATTLECFWRHHYESGESLKYSNLRSWVLLLTYLRIESFLEIYGGQESVGGVSQNTGSNSVSVLIWFFVFWSIWFRLLNW